jgi:hypothetical protein
MWYYLIDGKQCGPIDDATLDQLLANGTITFDSHVWKEGLTNWIPLGQLRGQVSPATGMPPAFVSASPAKTSTDTAWRDGNKVVTHDKQSLPPRCYKCNQSASEPPLKRQLSWHTPWLYLLVFLGLIIYVVVAIVVRDRAAVGIHLCPDHLKRRKFFIMGGWGGFFLGIALIVLAAAENQGWLAIPGILLLLISPIAGMIGASLAQAARIKDNTVWLTGANKEFLASLPQWP